MNSRILRSYAPRVLISVLAISAHACGEAAGATTRLPQVRENDLPLQAASGTGELNAGVIQNALSPSSALLTADGQFVLNETEWFAIQRYVKTSFSLPTDEQSVRLWLTLAPSDSFSEYQPLTSAFSDVHAHALDWESNLFPDTVKLALDLYNYSRTTDKAYERLRALLPTLDGDDAARNKFVQYLTLLRKEASRYEDRAGSVVTRLNGFAAVLSSDSQRVTTLKSNYVNLQNSDQGDLTALLARLDQLQKDVADLRAAYDEDVRIAATTPIYAFNAWPIGMIVGATVAGIYGARAQETLTRIHQLDADIVTLDAEKQKLYNTIANITAVSTELATVSDALKDAIPAVQKIHSHWQKMHSDLDYIASLVNEEISDEEVDASDLAIDLAEDAWHDVGVAAQRYQANAYIQVEQP